MVADIPTKNGDLLEDEITLLNLAFNPATNDPTNPSYK